MKDLRKVTKLSRLCSQSSKIGKYLSVSSIVETRPSVQEELYVIGHYLVNYEKRLA